MGNKPTSVSSDENKESTTSASSDENKASTTSASSDKNKESTTSVSSDENKESTTSVSSDENKESITLLWFDPNIGSREDTEKTKQKLREINDYVRFYTDLELCVTYIQSIISEKILLITSGSRASQILPRISNLRQIDSIFIFCMKIDRYQHLTNEYPKIISIYNNLDALCLSIREQIDLVDKQIQAFSFLDQHQQSTKDLSKQSAEFLWFQLFNHVILRLPRNQQAKQQMIDMCRQYYHGHTKQLGLIDQFEREYRPEDAIRWYSKQSFVYKLVNKALRSEDIDQLHTFRFFISDLSENLAREHEKILLSEEEILTVYRGVKLDKAEFDKLKQNQGKLISTNGYLSTSRLRSKALLFAVKPTKRTDVVPVLFEIKCNIKELGKNVIFADISKISIYPKEQEVLFDLSAAFQLECIEKDGEVQLIRMTTTKDAGTITKYYLEETHRETEEKSVSIVFGRLMCNLGQYDKSQKYFEQLLKDPNGEDLAWIEHNIGRALHFKGEWTQSREYYDRAYHRMMNAKPARVKDSAYVLSNIGVILCRQGKYNEALEYYQRALKIREKYYPSDHVDIATSLNNIGIILQIQAKYDEALDYYQRALQMREKYYPSGHVDIAASFISIGNILHSQAKYDEALDYYQRALKMQEKYYPSGHVDIATSLNNIGIILRNQVKYDEALDYYQRALQMQEKYYPSGHVDIASSLSRIGVILYRQGKYNEALEYYQRALKMREKYYPSGHVDIATSFISIDNILHSQAKYDEALDYYQRALKMQEKYYPSGHVDIATSLNNIGNILGIQAKYDEALDYYQRALQIEEKYYPSGHVGIGFSLRNIGLCYEKQNKSKAALDYFQQALTICEKYLPVGHPYRVKIEQDIRQVTGKK
jgi:tetratricopeptide (TPR) repeat protein